MRGLLLGRILHQVHPDERARFGHAALALALIASAAIIARTAGTTLLLSSFDAHLLPWMYVTTAALTISAALGLSHLMHRMRPDRVVAVVALGVAGAWVVVWIGLGHGSGFAIAAFVLADGMARVLVALFWGMAALLFNPREGKRLLGTIGAAATVACIIAGAAVPVLSRAFGTRNLLVPVVLLVAGFAATALHLGASDPAAVARLTTPVPMPGLLASPSTNRALIQAPLVGNLGLLVMVSMLALFLNDFAFLSAARGRHAGEALAPFLGHFYALASIIALIVQLFVLPWLLRNGGVIAGLMALPGVLLMASAGAAASGAFPMVFIAKLADPVLLFTVDAAAVQLLYQGMRRQSRFRARTLVDGIGKPLAITLAAAVLLVGASRADPRLLALAIAVACAAWLFLARRCAASYVDGLMEQLGSHALDLDEVEPARWDPGLAGHLRGQLRDADDSKLPYLLELVRDAPGDWSAEHATLLSRPVPALRVAGLEYLARSGSVEHEGAIDACLADESPLVRASAVHALAQVAGGNASERIERLLADGDKGVRVQAAAALLEAGDLDAVAAGADFLEEMLDGEPESRALAARALARVSRVSLRRALGMLLQDSVPEVQQAALGVLRQRPVPELLPAIVLLLGRHDLVSRATEALVAAGPDAIAPLEAAARASGTPSNVRQRLPPVLSQFGIDALPALEVLSRASEPQVRRPALRGYCTAVGQHRLRGAQLSAAEQLARREAERVGERRALLMRVSELPGSEFLALVLKEEIEAHLADCFLLLGTSRHSLDVVTIRRHIVSGTDEERANAIELLDNVLGGGLRTELLKVLEGPSPSGGGDHHALHEILARQESESEWMVAGALHACAAGNLLGCGEHAVNLLSNPSPRVRETAIAGLPRLVDPVVALRLAGSLSNDEDAIVRELASQIAATRGSQGVP